MTLPVAAEHAIMQVLYMRSPIPAICMYGTGLIAQAVSSASDVFLRALSDFVSVLLLTSAPCLASLADVSDVDEGVEESVIG